MFVVTVGEKLFETLEEAEAAAEALSKRFEQMVYVAEIVGKVSVAVEKTYAVQKYDAAGVEVVVK